jgi:hypothetical protein
MTVIDGNTLEGVSATTLWTLHNRATEAKRSDGVIRDPWAVTLLDTIDYDYRLLMYLEPEDALSLTRDCAARFPGGQMMFDSIPRLVSQRTLKGFKLSDRYIAPPMPFSLSADEGLAMAGTIPGVRVARDVPLAPGRGIWRFMSWKPLDRIGFVRRNRPSMTLLEFG